MDVCLSVKDYNKYPNQFNTIEKVDAALAASIGRVWLEVLASGSEVACSVEGFVSRGVSVYALVGESLSGFDFYGWLNKRLVTRLKVGLTPFNYFKIFSGGVLPRSVNEVLGELESLGSVVSPIVSSYGDSEVTGEVTTVLAESCFTLTSSSGEVYDVFEEDGEVILGRGSGSGVLVKGKGVSRNHCKLRVSGDTLELFDLGSTNGTRVNGRRICSHVWKVLSVGDILKVGVLSLTVGYSED